MATVSGCLVGWLTVYLLAKYYYKWHKALEERAESSNGIGLYMLDGLIGCLTLGCVIVIAVGAIPDIFSFNGSPFCYYISGYSIFVFIGLFVYRKSIDIDRH